MKSTYPHSKPKVISTSDNKLIEKYFGDASNRQIAESIAKLPFTGMKNKNDYA